MDAIDRHRYLQANRANGAPAPLGYLAPDKTPPPPPEAATDPHAAAVPYPELIAGIAPPPARLPATPEQWPPERTDAPRPPRPPRVDLEGMPNLFGLK